MDRSAALKVFESLGSSLRLDIFCQLVQAGEAGKVAGEISEHLGIPATNLSFHLKAMLQAGLVSVSHEGRFQRYRANVPHMLRVMAFVMENCARAEAGEALCSSGRRTAATGGEKPPRAASTAGD
ncbi:MAG: ArsR/SmtB family transcription factor [Burkholderiales bacterium]